MKSPIAFAHLVFIDFSTSARRSQDHQRSAGGGAGRRGTCQTHGRAELISSILFLRCSGLFFKNRIWRSAVLCGKPYVLARSYPLSWKSALLRGCLRSSAFLRHTEAPGTTYRDRRQTQRYPLVNIGRRLSTSQVYALSSRLQLAPIGVAGEIYSGGEDMGAW